MATGTTITRQSTGNKLWLPTEIIPFLQQAKADYKADEAGMIEGGQCLTSTYTSYCDITSMQSLMDATEQQYKGTAAQYAAAYNSLFEIDC